MNKTTKKGIALIIGGIFSFFILCRILGALIFLLELDDYATVYFVSHILGIVMVGLGINMQVKKENHKKGTTLIFVGIASFFIFRFLFELLGLIDIFYKLNDFFFFQIIGLIIAGFGGKMILKKSTPSKIDPLIIGGLFGGLFGFLASQYFPLFGGLAIFGEPFSPARMTLISGHVFLFLAIGITIGYIYRLNIMNKISNKD